LCKLLGSDYQSRFDEFDLCQLAKVIEVCRQCKSRAEAGKRLFAISRQQRNTTNDSDRLGKYLEKFGLTFQMCKDGRC
jgi:transcriptional regulatory protein RtcR